jgi:HupE / UreJ protein
MKILSSARRMGRFHFQLAALLILSTVAASAHTQSTSYLTLVTTPTNLTGEWHLALRDLEDAVGLDANDDGVITWGELSAQKEVVSAYALSRLHIRGDGQMGTIHIDKLLVDNHSDGAYAVLRFEVGSLKSPTRLEFSYKALFDVDPKHRGLLRLEDNGITRLAVFDPASSSQTFDLTKPAQHSPFLTFLMEGVWHIWSGYDHILFLLALLLPGVLLRRDGQWQPVSAARPAFVNVLKIVTAFTVAHSITLSLSALGYVHLPTRLVESAIAASVVLAAFNNLVPFFAERGWMVAFGFGLLHGFGFANALRDLGLHSGQLAATLFGFNLGVELGQLAIVAVFLPLALSLRRLLFYQRFVLRLGSAAIIFVASSWLAERVFDFKWLPF